MTVLSGLDVERAWRRVHDSASALPLDLPRRLGVSERAVGGFSEFARSAPLVDPIVFVPTAWRRGDVEGLRQAHLRAGFWGLAADRSADGQGDVDEPVLRHLAAEWQTSLAGALGDSGRAARVCSHAQLCFAEGVSRERAASAARTLSWAAYRMTVSLRTRWLTTTVCAAVGPERRSCVQRCFDATLLAMQMLDDSADHDEDRRLRGASVPDLFGISPSAAATIAHDATQRAASLARDEGLVELAGWLTERTAFSARFLAADPTLRMLDAVGAASVLIEHA